MKKLIFMFVVFLFSCSVKGPTPEQIANADYGKNPSDISEGVIKEYMKTILYDPMSAVYEIQSPYQGWVQKGFAFEDFGWWVPALINSKNRFGGYVGFKKYEFFFKNGFLRKVCQGNANNFCIDPW